MYACEGIRAEGSRKSPKLKGRGWLPRPFFFLSFSLGLKPLSPHDSGEVQAKAA